MGTSILTVLQTKMLPKMNKKENYWATKFVTVFTVSWSLIISTIQQMPLGWQTKLANLLYYTTMYIESIQVYFF